MQVRYMQIGAVVVAVLTIVAVSRLNDDVTVTKMTTAAPAKWTSTPTALTPMLAAMRHASGSAHDPTLSEQVDSLMATHDPAKAFVAYFLLSDCADFNRDHDRITFDLAVKGSPPLRGMTDSEKQHDEKLCSGMTERMRLSRIDYLEFAAAGGISGAIVQMAKQGPFGDRSALVTRPDDPLVKEWRKRVIDQLTQKAESGDLLTLNNLWVLELNGDALIAKNPALAYRYAAVQGLIDRELNGSDAIYAKMYAPYGPLMLSIEGLSPEQRIAELAAAQRIADIARERRQHETKKL